MGNAALLDAENLLFTIAMLAYFAAMMFYFIFVAARREMPAHIAFFLQAGGLLVHTAALILRGIAAGRLPMTNQYEFATGFAWGLSLVSLIFVWKYHFQLLGVFSMPVVFLVIGYAAMQSKDVHELMPALRSNWLGFHVSTAIIAYGAFGVSFALGLIFLLRERVGGASAGGGNASENAAGDKEALSRADAAAVKVKQEAVQGSFLSKHMPSAERLDLIGYRSVSLGLMFLTFTILTGAIWAERAWGSYWSWDPKETWSLITWIIYAIYLHLRVSRGMRGKAAAVFAVLGFICVLFTYIGVNTLLPGIHSYA